MRQATSVYSTPAPVPQWRARLEASIEGAIALLDSIDGDPDLEPDHDAEPSADTEFSVQFELRGGARVAA
jgi:hypothetical protein